MKRMLYDDLLRWKESKYRKPLIIMGARQVGKTYLISEFAKNEYENYVILNCDKDERVAGIFEHGFRTDRIISDMEIISDQKIHPGKTLIFIDEIGEAPKALASLKYFCEDAPEYHIVVAGSLLGLAIHEGVSFPVGKVDELTLYPMSFAEYILADMGEEAYRRIIEDDPDNLVSLREPLIEKLKEYYFLGGMPEVVRGKLEGRDYKDLRDVQKRILADYAMDISKHAPNEILGRIHQVWNSIPQQLTKRNNKFKYGDIQKGARAREYEMAIEWLIDAGVIYKISRVRKAGMPLKFYEDLSAFKLFLLDHGLMGAMVDASVAGIMIGKGIFEEYSGAFTEQYVLEQLKCMLRQDVFYFDSESSKLELDFLISGDDKLVPIEVKATENLRSKSLRQFYQDYPDSVPVRVSMSDYREQDWMKNLPLYVCWRVL